MFDNATWGPSVLINPPGTGYVYNGLYCCEAILKYALNNSVSFPAISIACSKKVEIGGVTLQGFLGASG